MHGRPRVKGPEDPERVKAAAKKAVLLGQLLQEVLARRHAQNYNEESLAFAAKLLELNPEVYTVWNYRREALLPIFQAGGTAAVVAAERELSLTQRALQRNPKSYSTWHHRKWVVAYRFTSLEQELQLVGMLLDADERNFHGWNYRRFVIELMGTPAERALDYARHKIDQNFSNYSAWHSRTVLLPLAHAPQEAAAAAQQGQQAGHQPVDGEGGGGSEIKGVPPVTLPPSDPSSCQEDTAGEGGMAGERGEGGDLVPKRVLDEEYELVKQAFYTEPEDQSGWFYHRWLLGCSWAHWQRANGSEREGTERQSLLVVIGRELAMCEDLLEIEPGSKWPLLTSARLKEMQQQLLLCEGRPQQEKDGTKVPHPQQPLTEEVRKMYATLADVDPMRRGFYKDAVEGRAAVVMRSAAR